MAAAAPPSAGGGSGGGLHFDFPEGTTSITQPYAGEGHDSWAEFGVDKTKVTSVGIPTSVTSIGVCAFQGCILLARVAIPSSVTRIEFCAFDYCRSLTSVDIPTSVTSIAKSAFLRCISLASVDIPASVTSIAKSAFKECSSLTRIGIPASVTIINLRAFDGCSSLTRVGIPASVDFIDEHAFRGCSSLASVELHTSMASIENCAFQGCSSLTTVLVRPGGADGAVGAANHSDSNVWPRLFASFIGMAENEDYDYEDSDDDEEVEAECDQLFSDETRIWAPDHIVAQLTGPFNDCKRFADVPRALRAAPDAKTWAGVQNWLWWLPPTAFTDGDRVVCKARIATIWTTMVAGFRAEMTASLLGLPEELWLHMFTFLKHDQQPVFSLTYVDTDDEEEEEDDDEEDDDPNSAQNILQCRN